MQIRIEELEKNLEIKIKKNYKVLGIDTASRTGWCKLRTDKNNIYLENGFIHVDTTNKYMKYDRYIELFKDLLSKEKYDTVVIEETFYSRNVLTFQLLSRLGAFAYTICKLLNIDTKSFILATSARKKLGLVGNAKKKEVHEQFLAKIDLKLTDIDIIDAIILALCGVIEDEK